MYCVVKEIEVKRAINQAIAKIGYDEPNEKEYEYIKELLTILRIRIEEWRVNLFIFFIFRKKFLKKIFPKISNYFFPKYIFPKIFS